MTERQKLLPEWDWRVDVKGVENPDLARTLARDTREVLYLLSASGFDLRTLDGVTIATDYAQALRELDRGLKCRSVATPTAGTDFEGVAMAVGVLREGRQRTHLVLSSWIPTLLRSDSEARKCQAFGAIAHEAAHIHLAAKLESRIPDVYADTSSLQQYPPALQSAAMRMWDEYAATRMSGYLDPEAAGGYRDNIKLMLEGWENSRLQPILAYQRYGDYQRLFSELSVLMEKLLCSFAYLLGHLDSLDLQLDVSDLCELTGAVPGAREVLQTLHERLRALWLTQDCWNDLDVFSPLCDLVNELLRGCGVSLAGHGASWRLNILTPPERVPELLKERFH